MQEPLVLVPGLVCDARVFAPQINSLSRKYTVQVANLSQGGTIREMAAHLLDQAPARFALAGHSMGGIVAMEVARRAPERVSRLALMSTSPLPDTPAQAAWREPLIVRAQAGRLAEAVARRGHTRNTSPRRGAGGGFVAVAANGARLWSRGFYSPPTGVAAPTGCAADVTKAEGADHGAVRGI